MTRDDMLTKLRDDRDAAAARGDLVEALLETAEQCFAGSTTREQEDEESSLCRRCR